MVDMRAACRNAAAEPVVSVEDVLLSAIKDHDDRAFMLTVEQQHLLVRIDAEILRGRELHAKLRRLRGGP